MLPSRVFPSEGLAASFRVSIHFLTRDAIRSLRSRLIMLCRRSMGSAPIPSLVA